MATSQTKCEQHEGETNEVLEWLIKSTLIRDR